MTVLAEDMRENVAAKVAPGQASKVRVIPNFVDTAWITPQPRENAYRRELGLEGKTVVMYAGNIGMSQSLELMLAAGDSARARSRGRVRDQRRRRGPAGARGRRTRAAERALRRLAAPRPAARGARRGRHPRRPAEARPRPLERALEDLLDPGRRAVPCSRASTAAPRSSASSSDPARACRCLRTIAEAFTKALTRLVAAPDEVARMGAAGRRFVEGWASPEAVAEQYEHLFTELRDHRR